MIKAGRRFGIHTHIRPSVRPSVSPSVRSSVRSSGGFLRIGSLLFSDFLHEDRKLPNLKSDGARFLKKNLICPFWAIMADFWPENRVICNFLKIYSLKFSDILHEGRQ